MLNANSALGANFLGFETDSPKILERFLGVSVAVTMLGTSGVRRYQAHRLPIDVLEEQK
jgi:hypothetical protein